MKIFLYADDDGNMHFNSEIAREYMLEMVDGLEPQRTNIMKIKTARELAKRFFAAAIQVAQGEHTIEIFKKMPNA